jgi:cytoskeletal protein CcmA (bactofilin family)
MELMMLFTKKKTAEIVPLDERLFINKDSKLTGTIDSTSHIIIAGEFDGTINAKHLEITASGAVKGTVNAESVTVAGTAHANIKCAGRFKIDASGKVIGEIQYGSLEVALGGISVGNIEQTGNMRIVRPQINLANITDKR